MQTIHNDDVPGFIKGREHGGACQGRHVSDVVVEAVKCATELDQVHNVVTGFVKQLGGAAHVASPGPSEEGAKGAAPGHAHPIKGKVGGGTGKVG